MKSFWKTFVLILFAWVGGLTASFAQNQSNDNVYAVGTGENCDPRLKVVFHMEGEDSTVIYITEADQQSALFDAVVYNPWNGTTTAGVSFYGWTTKDDYNANDTASAKTFVQVRNELKNITISTHSTHVVHYYAMLFKHYTVTYLDENDIVVDSDVIPYRYDALASHEEDYTVDKLHTPYSELANFEGWRVKSGASNIVPAPSNLEETYKNSNLKIKGDVVFYVYAPQGNWLVFDENGKGAKYNAPQFVKSGEVTAKPCDDEDMTRFGYTFGGWYSNKECTGNQFTFGNSLTEKTTIYAKWIPNTTANYTIIIWKQNLAGDGYDFEESIPLSGTVGNEINTVAAQNGTGNDNSYARVNGRNKQYTGFHLKDYDRNVTIKTEGNAVLNVYYDRNEYVLTFQAHNFYEIATDNNGTQYGFYNNNYVTLYYYSGTWYRTRTSNWGRISYSNPYNGTRYKYVTSWTTIKTITALYQQPIGDNFPIEGTNGVTYNNGERWDPQSNTPYNEVLVYIDVMPDADVVFRLDEANRPLKTMNWYVEALPNESEPTVSAPNTLYGYNNQSVTAPSGKRYVLYKSIGARYNGVTIEDFIEINGYARLGSDKAREGGYYIYNVTQNGTINFYYTRNTYTINFMDGEYVDGYDNQLSETGMGQISIESGKPYGSDISSYNSYTPDASHYPSGYVFEGWYLDNACTQPYTFTTMPEGGITVYAKWRQKQYRVFLHPNAGTSESEPTLEWGSETVELNFRVSYDETVSTPTGTRNGWVFVGWYEDGAFTRPFSSDIRLNDGNTTSYDKTTDFTDPMDQWGNGAISNSDLTGYNGGDRFWITKKLDLYARWRKSLDGADGIIIQYDMDGGSATLVDDSLYVDDSPAVAQLPSNVTPPSAGQIFSHWQLQRCNSTGFEDIEGSTVLPGETFQVLKDNAKISVIKWVNPQNEDDVTVHDIITCSNPAPVPPDNIHTRIKTATYTVQLRAVYVEAESAPAPVSITWYKNDGTSDSETTPDLGVNEETNVYGPLTRQGYDFKGWTRQSTGCEPYIAYNNGTWESDDCPQVKVAADIMTPRDLYAVWIPKPELNGADAVCKDAEYTISETAINDASICDYEWSVTGGGVIESGQGTPSITVTWSTDGTVTLKVTDKTTGCDKTVTKVVTVNPLPVASIDNVEPLCPTVGSTTVTANVSSSSTSPYTYDWTGSDAALGLTNTTSNDATETFTATIPQACGTTYNLTLKVTDGNGCVSELATQTITVKTPATPVINTELANRDYGCDISDMVAPTKGDFTVTDECATTTPEVTLATGDIVTVNSCEKSRTYTATYTNVCGESAVSKEITYTWKVVETPTIALANGKSATNDLGCNPATKPVPDETWFDVTDNCKANAVATVTAGTESNDGCTHTIVYTANYTSECDTTKKADAVTVTVTWKEDTEKPVISLKEGSEADGHDWGCNPTVIRPEFEYTDNCDSDLTIDVTTAGVEGEGCNKSQTWKANVTDKCGNAATEVTVTYTWKEDTEKPVITPSVTSTPATNAGACQYTVPNVIALASISDNCTANDDLQISQSPAEGEYITENTDVTITVADGCNNTQTQVITVTLPTVLQSAITSAESFCYNTPDGVIEGTISDGQAPYTVSWTNGGTITGSRDDVTNIKIENLEDGDYIVTVTDVNGCHIDLDATIAQLSQTITLTADSKSKVYDGEELTLHTYTGADNLESGDVIVNVQFADDSRITNVGEVVNAITSFQIMRGDKDVTCYYDTAMVDGTLTITPKDVTITVNDTKVYDADVLVTEYTDDVLTVTGLIDDDKLIAGAVTTNGKDVATYTYDATSIISTAFETEKGISNYHVTYDLTQNITKRQVIFTSADSTKVYDGTELIKHEVTISGDGFAPNEGVTFDVTGSRTSVGSSDNLFTYTLVEGTKADNYNIEVVYGKLIVTSDEKSIEIASASKSWTYDCETHNEDVYTLTYGGTAIDAESDGKTFVLPTGDKLVVTSTADGVKYYSEDYSENNTFTYVLDNDDQYTGERDTTFGTLSITKRDIVITAKNSTKTYDGTELTRDEFVTDGNEANCDEVVSATIVGSQLEVGETTNVISDAVIKSGDEDVTENYNITYVNGTLKVTPRENVIVTITKHSDNVIYDGEEHTVSGYDFESTDPLYIEEYMKFNGDEADSTAKGTEIGSYGMSFDETYFENINENFKDVTFVVNSNDSLVINALEGVIVTITEHADTFIYDGEVHTVSGYEVDINNDLYKVSDFTFNGDSTISGTTVGKYSMPVEPSDFVNNNVNFKDVTFVVVPDTMVIDPRENVVVTITKHSETVIYDGEEHTVSGYEFESSDPLYIESYMKFTGEEADSIAKGTEIGSYGMTFDETYFENINENFKDVTFVVNSNDSLVINALEDIIVTITEHADTFIYDGESHTVKGYDVAINSDLYKVSDFTFNGDSTISGTTVGEYSMPVEPSDFVNNNVNFKDVTFVVVPDTMVIDPRENVIVTITKHSETVIYDGEEHTVSGYEFESTDPLYIEEYMKFNGVEADSTATGTAIGSYGMTFDNTYFENINENFKDVTFVVNSDDSLVINALEGVIVTITEHADTFIYDGEAHTVKGYDVAINSDLYKVSDFTFNGDSTISGTTVGKYSMPVEPGDFVNNNVNFKDVTFVVVPDTMVIDPRENVVVTITKHSDAVIYDGEEHTVSGYEFESNDPLYIESYMKFTGEEADSIAKGTEIGSYGMTFDETYFENINENFKDVVFNVVEDSLVINALEGIIVTITEHADTFIYDGESHTVKGYDVAINSDLYKVSDFTFNGDSTISGTTVGKYSMPVESADFVNNNVNFKDVTFVVVPDTMVIDPRENVVVTITKHSETVIYDGEEHTVSGYEFESSDPLYIESYMKFTGEEADSIAKGTEIGSYGMTFDETYFENINENFKDVAFNVVEDSLVINALEGIIVTITEHADTFIYDGEVHTVTGYEVDINNDLYKVSDFTFNGDSTISGTTVGEYSMPVESTDFVNNNTNFKDVTFVVVDKTMLITPRENVIVTITKHSDAVIYDGEEHTVSGYEFESNDPLYIESYIKFTGEEADSIAKGTEIGSYGMTFDETYFENINENFKDVTFVVNSNDSLVINALEGIIVTITEHADTFIYDGEAHTVKGYDVAINSDLYKVSDFTFNGDSTISGTTVGKYSMPVEPIDFVNNNVNFKDVTFVVVPNTMVIDPRENVVVTITKHSETVIYDGEEHTVTGYDFESTDPLYIEEYMKFNGDEADSTATGTAIGSYGMTFDETYFENINENFKDVVFNVVEDSLVINALEGIIVTITEHADTFIYDGEAHTVKGYDVAINNDLYKVSDFMFNGDSTISGTTVGKYSMPVEPGDFVNNNVNFKDVTFVVVPDTMVIDPRENVVVTITKHSETVIYDGEEHTVSGYEFESNDPLYIESYMKFTGEEADSIAKGTEIGSYGMSFDETYFENINENFKDVTFLVNSDDSLVINALEGVIVTITEHADTFIYDGEAHTVKGYDVAINSDLYKVSDFTFNGDSTISGTTVGKYSMPVEPTDFVNNNVNFKDVTFVVVPDTMVIDPRENVVVTITKHSETVIYDGEEHTVTGYDFESTDPLYIEDYMKFNGNEADSTATGTAIGSYGMTFDETYFENINENFKDVTFVVNSNDSLVINALEGIIVTITEHADTFIYDGEVHTVTGYEVDINNDLYKVSDFTFNGDSTISGTTVGKYSMLVEPSDFVNNNVNFKDVTFVVVPDTMVIDPRENVVVTITKHSETVIYDGEEHTVSGYEFESNDPLYIESYMKFTGEEADSIAKGTEIGSYGMTFDNTYFENINENFKDVTFVVNSNDSLVINALEGIIVTITEHADTFIYDGEAHTVKGYEVAINSDLYKVSDFTFNGDSTISGTTVGKYSMPVEPSDFVNNNVNFKDVTFVVVPDTMVIDPRENVVVTIIKHSETVIYDGEEHTVTGYDFESTDPLYIEDYMKFNGVEADSTATGTAIGSYGMSFDETYFENINENFKDVAFNVVEDSLVINALEGIIVTITEHADTFIYDGEVHTVSGYEVDINNDLYKVSDFTFNGDSTISGTTVGKYSMPVEPSDFVNNNVNFKDVTFVVVPDTMVIDPRENVVVTITKHSETVIYDGEEHTVTGYDFESTDPLYIESYMKFTGEEADSIAKGTEIGSYGMSFDETYFENINENFKDVTFIVNSNDSLVINALEGIIVTITEHADTFIYDGEAHTVKGYDVAINSDLYKVSDFTFNGDSTISGTTVGEYSMPVEPSDFVNNNVNFKDVTFVVVPDTMVIDPRENVVVTITKHSETVIYDGEEHTVTGYDFESTDPLYIEEYMKFNGNEADSTATGTAIGSYGMTFDETYFENINENFKDVTFVVNSDDSLVINALEGIIVTITEHADTFIYDGEAHTVSGYEVDINNDLYKVSDFTFNGDSTISGTTVGKYSMPVESADFVNNNVNFKDVTFVVVPDTMVIDPRENVVVTITKHSETVIYDGEEHTVSGYEFESSDPLYIESYMKFTGEEADSIAKGTEIGSYGMSFDETYFENINENFKDVTFVVNSDDSLVINALEGIIVTITEHADTFIYDGEAHTVKGYDVAINSDLYKVSDFTFNGDSTISGTTVGKYSMPVEPSDFVNNNVNFKDVTFVVVPDTMVIDPRENVVVTITKHSDNVIYDGEEHTVTGYDFESTDPLYIEEYMKFNGNEADSTATGTAIGSYGMTFDETYFENINENFKNVTFVVNSNDSLVINALEGIIVTITEHADTFIYDGEAHTVKGYDVAINSDLYKVSDFTFNGDSTISGTTVGKYSMPVEPTDFVNNNVNFKDVTFVVVPDTMVIDPRENVIVTITKHSDAVIYDGEEHTVSGYEFESNDPLYIESYMKFTGEEADSIAKGTEIGSYGMTFDNTYFENINENFKDVTFVVNSDDSLVINALEGIIVTITEHADTFIYDGESHTVKGYDVAINSDLYKVSDFTFNGDSTISGTTVGKYSMPVEPSDFVNNNVNFKDVTFVVVPDTMVIDPRENVVVTITKHSDAVIYDGEEHTVSGYEFESSDPLYIESYMKFNGEESDSIATGKEIGSYGMSFDETYFENINENFKDVTFVVNSNDSLVINALEGIIVTITEHADTFIYDGEAHTVKGYDVAINSDLYKVSDFTFNGDSTISGTTVGKYSMPVEPSDFVNNNVNFKDVTFVVVPDTMVIDPRENVVVTITKHSETVIYDGEEHTVTGYDFESTDPLYIEDYMKFNGVEADSTATGTAIGSYGMTFDNTYFENINENFKDVTFVVNSNDSLVINALEGVIVTITEHADTFIYDGEAHTVKGYDVAINSDLYKVSDFTFNGDSTISGTTVGKYSMPVDPADFVNNNVNFKDVTFVVEDKAMVIKPRESIVVTIIPHSDTVKYTSSKYTVTGYDVIIPDPMYQESDILFDGVAEISGTLVGEYPMELTSEQFTNNNTNFQVVFDIKEGGLVIMPNDTVVVYVHEHGDEVVYDGQRHEVTEFHYTFNNEFCRVGKVKRDRTKKYLVEGTEVGVYHWGLQESYFSYDDDNFVNVKFVIIPDSLVILPRTDVEVTIVPNTDTFTYDGEMHTVTHYTIVSSDSLFTEQDLIFHGNDTIHVKDAGEYEMNILATDFESVNPNFGHVTFKVKEGQKTVVEPMRGVEVVISTHGDSIAYDGTAHTVSGFEVEANSELYKREFIDFTGDSTITATEVGEYTMVLNPSEFTNNNKNFEDVTFIINSDNKLVIESLDGVQVVLKKHGAVVSYNGQPQSVSGYDLISISDSLYHADYFSYIGTEADTIATRTTIGTAVMSLSADDFQNNNETFADVRFIILEDTLTVVPNDHEVVVIREGAKLVPFDGEEHMVTGYTLVSSTDGAYTTSNFTFSGCDTVRGKEVGAYSMNLKAEDFTNIDTNYVNVTFVIEEDSLAIVPLQSIVVTIYEHADTFTFDGKEHIVSGYDIESSISYYDAKDFDFVGDSVIKKTNAGEYKMNLKVDDFKNTNENFTDVTFNVVPAVTKILPKETLHVTIYGNIDTVIYNGGFQEVKGYTWKAKEGFEFYKEFKFTGNDVAKGVKIGDYYMGLKESDFRNTSSNYKNVIFEVVDGYIHIDRVPIPIIVSANTGSKIYDGKEYQNTGYSYTRNALQTGDRITAVIQGRITNVGTVENRVVSYKILRGTEDVTANYNFGTAVHGTLTILPRTVVLTSADSTKLYDGTPLTQDSIRIEADGWAEGEGADIQITGKQLEVGESRNTFTYELWENTDLHNYEIEEVYGTLTVTSNTDEVIIAAANDTFLYDGKEHSSNHYRIVGGYIGQGDSLIVDVEGVITEAGKAANKVVGYRVVRGAMDVTDYYTFGTPVDGTLLVQKRKVTLISGSAEREYNGEELTNDTIFVEGDGWAEGEGAVYTVTGSRLYPGDTANKFTYELDANTLAKNYTITKREGKLTVLMNTQVLDITAASATKMYDGTPLEDSSFTYTEGILAEGDILYVKIEGSITEVGVDTNRIVDYRIMRGDLDVTDFYTIGEVNNGILRVQEDLQKLPFVIVGKDHSIEMYNVNAKVRVYDMLGRLVKIDGAFEVEVGAFYHVDVMNQGVYVVFVEGDKEGYKVIVR